MVAVGFNPRLERTSHPVRRVATAETIACAGAIGYPARMSANSSIEWTDATWNPVRGCTKISPGCTHCYAEVFAERFRGVPGHPYEQGFDLRFVPEKLAEPLLWPRPKMVFVNSMSDLFHEEVPVDYIHRVARVMEKANWHTYQVLTKRSERMRDLLQGELRDFATLPHIWWGVSVENRKHGLPRIDDLRTAPAAMRFLSVEPLLEDLGQVNLDGIHWMIVGGESGHGARPLDQAWAISLRDQCRAAGVPFSSSNGAVCAKERPGASWKVALTMRRRRARACRSRPRASGYGWLRRWMGKRCRDGLDDKRHCDRVPSRRRRKMLLIQADNSARRQEGITAPISS